MEERGTRNSKEREGERGIRVDRAVRNYPYFKALYFSLSILSRAWASPSHFVKVDPTALSAPEYRPELSGVCHGDKNFDIRTCGFIDQLTVLNVLLPLPSSPCFCGLLISLHVLII